MKQLPSEPFLAQDYSPRGGGLDFLGLRWANLNMVGTYLIPEINNVTTDMGTFLLAGWVPWKFQQLCTSSKDYTEKNYRLFREKVETAMSLTFRDDLGFPKPYGNAHNRIGITNTCPLPGKLSFTEGHRDERNSIYAPAIYGPSLKSLGLITSLQCMAEDLSKTCDIAIAGTEADAVLVFKFVDLSLKKSKSYSKLISLTEENFTFKDVLSLAQNGMDPTFFRSPEQSKVKTAFLRMLLPDDPASPGYQRSLTTRLLLSTLAQTGDCTSVHIRNVWYTGLISKTKTLSLKNPDLQLQRKMWATFMARQFQRYSIELFLHCFEVALKNGFSSIDTIVDYWVEINDEYKEVYDSTFHEFLKHYAGTMFENDDLRTSKKWNSCVDTSHERFLSEHIIKADEVNHPALAGLIMLACWYWRMLVRLEDEETKDLLQLGGSDRMSIKWFFNWLKARQSLTLKQLLHDIFSDLVFSQHIRIALSRFDGTSQRLRFLLGDNGIEATIGALHDLGKLRLPWMPDRLDALIHLLVDCDVLTLTHDKVGIGKNATNFAPDLVRS